MVGFRMTIKLYKLKYTFPLFILCFFISLFMTNINSIGAELKPSTSSPTIEQQVNDQGVDPEVAFAYVLAEAESGNSEALLALGTMYEQGVGIPRNFTKALEWYTKAAESGKAEGYYNVGVCYEIGMGTVFNLEKAFQNYNKAAAAKLPMAYYKLAGFYLTGSGTTKNIAKGLDNLNKASNANLASAANELGVIYLNGLFGQKTDHKRALNFFIKGSDNGSIDSIRNLAVMFKTGNGVKEDPIKAYKWFIIAHRGGYAGNEVTTSLEEYESSLSTTQLEKGMKEADDWINKFNKNNAK